MRRDFHLALASAFVPVLGVPLVLALAARASTITPPEEERFWKRALYALAALDVAIVSIFLAATMLGQMPEPPAAVPAGEDELALAARCEAPRVADLVSIPYEGGFFALLGILFLRARRTEGPRGGSWAVVALPIAATVPASFLLWPFTCPETGVDPHVSLAAMLLTTGAILLVGGGLGIRWVTRDGPMPALTQHAAPASDVVPRALLYIWAAVARAVLLLTAWVMLGPSAEMITDTPIRQVFERLSDPTSLAIAGGSVVLLAPVAEELVFRGILLPGLARQMDVRLAVLASAFLFALLHGPSHGPVGVAAVTGLGVVLGWARVRSGGLLAPVLVHALHNALVFALVMWALSAQPV